MIRIGKHLSGCALALALVACASAPLHYYTLVPPASGDNRGQASATPMAGSAGSLPFELLPVGVPAQVDLPQLVIRQGGQGIAVLNGERWIAPLGDEVRSALSADLMSTLHGQDASGLPDNGKPLLRIKLDLHRFDSVPGSYALIEATWSVRLMHGTHAGTAACSSRISETVGPGYDALVQGHQRAIGALATQIAAAAVSLEGGQSPVCPAS